MLPVHSAFEITDSDTLMQKAATALSEVIASFNPKSVLLVVGSGGNGGDALYAGATLAMNGTAVSARCIGTPHPRAYQAFLDAGGSTAAMPHPDLVVDGFIGVGGRPGLPDEVAAVFSQVSCPIIAADIPSGISAETGERGTDFVTADITVAFGVLRPVHAMDAACGEVLFAPLPIELPPSPVHLRRIIAQDLPGRIDDGFPIPPLAPSANDDKYSGGVVGVLAGSRAYPGAGLLCVKGALRATPSMVRAPGMDAAPPEVVTVPGRVQSWVFGPGRGTEDDTELRDLVARDEPLVIDADGLTLLSRDPGLLAGRDDVVITPHDGECDRLCQALGVKGSRVEKAQILAKKLRVIVVLKGRFTLVTDGERVEVIDAGHSWAATPGSGDVLAGILGAWAARVPLFQAAVTAVSVHALAAWIAAGTPDGPAPVIAGDIIDALPRANARATSPRD